MCRRSRPLNRFHFTHRPVRIKLIRSQSLLCSVFLNSFSYHLDQFGPFEVFSQSRERHLARKKRAHDKTE